MCEGQEPDTVDKSTQLAEQRTTFATERTLIAEERTLMAWIRTAISLIGFGFTIFQFFQYLGQVEIFGYARPQAPRYFGLALIAVGTLSLVVAAWQHNIFLNQIGIKEPKQLWSLAFIVSLLMILIGIFAFIVVLSD